MLKYKILTKLSVLNGVSVCWVSVATVQSEVMVLCLLASLSVQTATF